MNTKFEYMYRCAGNFKYRDKIIVKGIFALNDLSPFLHMGEFFVPTSVGLKSLVPSFQNDDDHVYHEIEEIDASMEASSRISAATLIARFRRQHQIGWPLPVYRW